MPNSPSTPNTHEKVRPSDANERRIAKQRMTTHDKLMPFYSGAWELLGNVAGGTAAVAGTTVVLAGEAVEKIAMGLARGVVGGIGKIIEKRSNAA